MQNLQLVSQNIELNCPTRPYRVHTSLLSASTAHTHVALWSNQYALCSLESAVLLAKWLEVVTTPGLYPAVTDHEHKILDFVIEMVQETQNGATRNWLLENNLRLCATVTGLWSRLFGGDNIWEMPDLIGRSLSEYADLMES